MTYYQRKIEALRKEIYVNRGQLDTVIGVRNYIVQNYDRNLNLELLSTHRFVSKYHLLRLFKKYYGQTPKQYLTDTRIKKSKEYLKSGMKVTETCFAVGFESLSSFCTLFKNRNGVTPGEYQKEQLSRSK